MDYQKLLTEIRLICIEQGELLEKALKSPDDIKFIIKDRANWSETEIATKLDQLIEEELYTRLSKKFPELGFYLEENPDLNDESKEFTCFIDPIDGTRYFAKNVPFFAISVGVMHGETPVLGVVYNPISEQLYAGAENIPTMLNNRQIKVSQEQLLNNSVLSLDVASHKENWKDEKDWMNQKVVELNLAAGKIRLFGNGSLSCAWTASGGIDGYVSIWGHGSKPFDIAAGKALIKYAGGKIIDLEIPGLTQPRFIGANPKLVEQISEILLQ